MLLLPKSSQRVLFAGLFFLSGIVASVAMLSSDTLGISQLNAKDSDTLAQFLKRSPGERDDNIAILQKLKQRTLAAIGGGKGKEEPNQRALGKIFDTPPEEALEQQPTQRALGPVAIGDPPVNAAAADPLTGLGAGDGATTGGVPIGGFPGGVSAVIPPAPDGGGAGGAPPVTDDGDDDPVPPIIVASPVPEPSAWALMIIGFMLCGAMMRKRPFQAKHNGLAGCQDS